MHAYARTNVTTHSSWLPVSTATTDNYVYTSAAAATATEVLSLEVLTCSDLIKNERARRTARTDVNRIRRVSVSIIIIIYNIFTAHEIVTIAYRWDVCACARIGNRIAGGVDHYLFRAYQ